jgi:Arc/MetJ-type ribon-helix-helix transcriptional regulator
MNGESILTDIRYALRQLRQFRDIERAIDALERVEEELAAERPVSGPAEAFNVEAARRLADHDKVEEFLDRVMPSIE